MCDGLVVQVLIEMDREDEQWGRVEEIYNQWRSAYSQFPLISQDLSTAGSSGNHEDKESSQDPESLKPGMVAGAWRFFHPESINN